MWAILISLSACSSKTQFTPTKTAPDTSSDMDKARQTLMAYFDELNKGEFQSAASRFGGNLSMLADWNADVNPSDPAALFQAACARQLQCLPIRSIVSARQANDVAFDFSVEFSQPDGSLFVLGPCCGANETDMPPVSQFDCSVVKSSEDDYKVMCLPVYVP
jgi:hypothetical protein